MKRFALLAAIVLCCSSVNAAPPGVEPELTSWWDNWHDAQGRLIVPKYRSLSLGTITPSDIGAWNELWVISVEPTTGPAAKQQAKTWMGHWGFIWNRVYGPTIDVP